MTKVRSAVIRLDPATWAAFDREGGRGMEGLRDLAAAEVAALHPRIASICVMDDPSFQEAVEAAYESIRLRVHRTGVVPRTFLVRFTIPDVPPSDSRGASPKYKYYGAGLGAE